MSKYDIKTMNHYDFFECSSAMQKSIRRGLEDEAMFWAVELFESNFVEYVWKRLKIISSEDIGLANGSISSEIQALYEMHKEQSKKKDDRNKPERLFLTHAVLLLCRSSKSRIIDWALIHFWNCHNARLRPIPDYALDRHNEKGRRLGRGWGHFFDEGTKLGNMDFPPDENDYKILSKLVFDEDFKNSPGKNEITEEEYKLKAKSAVNKECGSGLFD